MDNRSARPNRGVLGDSSSSSSMVAPGVVDGEEDGVQIRRKLCFLKGSIFFFWTKKQKSFLLPNHTPKMTEYWVSQGNKWCEFCKIYIANNPASIRTHELGERHKDNVAQRIANIRKENAAKEKEQKDAAKALQQIEAKAKRSYQKDLASFRESKDSVACASQSVQGTPKLPKALSSEEGWEFDAASGYYYNQRKGYHYDPNTSMYYSASIGKWVSCEEAFSASSEQSKTDLNSKPSVKNQSGQPPGKVVTGPINPARSVKGASSSISFNKRKRESEKPKAISKEEAAALKAREAAKKRVEEREAPMLGLYKSY